MNAFKLQINNNQTNGPDVDGPFEGRNPLCNATQKAAFVELIGQLPANGGREACIALYVSAYEDPDQTRECLRCPCYTRVEESRLPAWDCHFRRGDDFSVREYWNRCNDETYRAPAECEQPDDQTHKHFNAQILLPMMWAAGFVILGLALFLLAKCGRWTVRKYFGHPELASQIAAGDVESPEGTRTKQGETSTLTQKPKKRGGRTKKKKRRSKTDVEMISRDWTGEGRAGLMGGGGFKGYSATSNSPPGLAGGIRSTRSSCDTTYSDSVPKYGPLKCSVNARARRLSQEPMRRASSNNSALSQHLHSPKRLASIEGRGFSIPYTTPNGHLGVESFPNSLENPGFLNATDTQEEAIEINFFDETPGISRPISALSATPCPGEGQVSREITSPGSPALFRQQSDKACLVVSTPLNVVLIGKEEENPGEEEIEAETGEGLQIPPRLTDQKSFPAAKRRLPNLMPHYSEPLEDCVTPDHSGPTKTKKGLGIPRGSLKLLEQASSRHAEKIEAEDLTVNEKIGEGSFGTVYRGEYNDMDVAVKVLRRPWEVLTLDEKNEFVREISVAVQMNHTSVSRTWGFTTKPQLAIVMEYCENGSIAEYLANPYTQVSDHKKMEWFVRIAKGLNFIHKKLKVVHRDIAARNILLDANLKCQIGDFGLARFMSEDKPALTGPKRMAYNTECRHPGPVKWMAPESLLNREFTEKTDIWGFGITIFEIMTQNEPYPGVPPVEAALKVVMGDLRPDMSQFTAAPLLKDLLKKMWSKNPADRPSLRVILRTLRKCKKFIKDSIISEEHPHEKSALPPQSRWPHQPVSTKEDFCEDAALKEEEEKRAQSQLKLNATNESNSCATGHTGRFLSPKTCQYTNLDDSTLMSTLSSCERLSARYANRDLPPLGEEKDCEQIALTSNGSGSLLESDLEPLAGSVGGLPTLSHPYDDISEVPGVTESAHEAARGSMIVVVQGGIKSRPTLRSLSQSSNNSRSSQKQASPPALPVPAPPPTPEAKDSTLRRLSPQGQRKRSNTDPGLLPAPPSPLGDHERKGSVASGIASDTDPTWPDRSPSRPSTFRHSSGVWSGLPLVPKKSRTPGLSPQGSPNLSPSTSKGSVGPYTAVHPAPLVLFPKVSSGRPRRHSNSTSNDRRSATLPLPDLLPRAPVPKSARTTMRRTPGRQSLGKLL